MVDKNDGCIADVFSGQDSEYEIITDEDFKESMMNAKLISESPELLKLLIEINESFHNNDESILNKLITKSKNKIDEIINYKIPFKY